MAERLPPEPSPAARELLHAFREHQSPDRELREHGWQALQARLDLAGPATSAAANGAFYAKVVAVTVGIAAAVLLSLKVVGAGVAALSSQARQPAMEAPHQGGAEAKGGTAVGRAPQVLPSAGAKTTAAVDGVVEPTPAPVIEPEAAVVEPMPSPAAEPSARARTTGSTAANPATSTADLKAELEIIKRATEAMQQGRHADGLAALREHAERFGHGTMVDERVVLRAELLCASGRTDEARAQVQAFLRDRAGSALTGRMRRVCSGQRPSPQKP